MKVITLLIFLCGFNAIRSQDAERIETYIFEAEMNKTLEIGKSILRSGIQLPSFDPLTIDYLPTSFEIEKLLVMDGSVSNLTLSGIPDFIATHLKLNLLETKAEFSILVPHIQFFCNFKGNGTAIQFIPVFGDGTFKVDIPNVTLTGYVQLSIFPKLSVKDLKVETTLGDAVFEITGLMDNEEFTRSLVNTLNDHVATIINELKEDISSLVSSLLKYLINSILTGM